MNLRPTETFLVNDCDLIFAAEDDQGKRYIALHSDDIPGACQYAVIPASKTALESFAKGKMDLRSLMVEKGEQEWYLTALNHSTGEGKSQRQPTPISKSGYLPKAGYHPYPNRKDVTEHER